MNKEWMLLSVRERIKVLERQFKDLNKQCTLNPSPYCTVTKSRVKKTLELCILIEQLLLTSKAVYIDDEDACNGFDKLMRSIS